MRKKFLAVIIALVLICATLTACSESFKNDKLEGEQKTYYAVISNGGSAVQYGNYVYYINGYRGYEDDGSENYWGNVVKGGLYRAELRAGKDVTFEYTTAFGTKVTLTTFKSDFDPETNSDFCTYEEDVVTGYERDDDGEIVYDDNGNPVLAYADEKAHLVHPDLVASKTIGTSGYYLGGIFIYGDYVYYATPSNEQNRNEYFETTKTMFFRTKLDGTGTQRIYTSKNDTNNSAYAFYKRGDKVYLVVNDGTDIISVGVGAKVEDVKVIASDVTDVLFPVRDIYYEGIDTNQAEDFIYYTRDINDSDRVRSGNVVTAMRPDGSENIQILANGATVTLKSVDNGYLFYEYTATGGNVIMYSNLHTQFYGPAEVSDNISYSPTYRAAYDSNKAAIVEANGANSPLIGLHSGTALDVEGLSSFKDVICFRPSSLSDQVYSLCIGSGNMQIFDGVEFKTVYTGSVDQIYAIKDTYVYFGDGSGNYYRANVYTGDDLTTLGEGMSTSATFALDLMGDFVVMFGKVDDYASDYALFVNLDRIYEGAQFVGVKAEEDKYDPTVELNDNEE